MLVVFEALYFWPITLTILLLPVLLLTLRPTWAGAGLVTGIYAALWILLVVNTPDYYPIGGRVSFATAMIVDVCPIVVAAVVAFAIVFVRRKVLPFGGWDDE
jgi:hypothetical protein